MENIVIAGYARSPFTLAKKGALARVRPDDLVADVVRALVQRTGIDPAEIEDLILGCAFPEGEQGLNMARLVALRADLPLSVGGVTVNRFCARRCSRSIWRLARSCSARARPSSARVSRA